MFLVRWYGTDNKGANMKFDYIIEKLDEEAAELILSAREYEDANYSPSDTQYLAGVLIAARNHLLGVSPSAEHKD